MTTAGAGGAGPEGTGRAPPGATGPRPGPGAVVRVRAVATGRVQGVWYRPGCRREAERLGVAGWVTNRPNGSVEIEAEGPRPAVEALLAWARQGPARARVDRLAIEDLAPRGETGFRASG
jgi:acylphosphatase